MTNLVPMEWKGQRIMTTKTLAGCYETEENNIRNNYNNNKGRFIEGWMAAYPDIKLPEKESK